MTPRTWEPRIRGTEQDAWIWAELLGADDLRDAYDVDLEDGPRTAYSHDQPRDERGRWTGDGNTEAALDQKEVEAEARTQAELAAKNTDPLANIPFVLGADGLDLIGQRNAIRYVSAYGQSFKAAPKPADVKKMPLGECYVNATKLVLQRDDLDYAEGWAHPDGIPFPILHAWAVTKDGTVVDPTLNHPEKSQYFGIRYARDKYLKSVFRNGYYGVLGSTSEVASRAVWTGGKDVR